MRDVQLGCRARRAERHNRLLDVVQLLDGAGRGYGSRHVAQHVHFFRLHHSADQETHFVSFSFFLNFSSILSWLISALCNLAVLSRLKFRIFRPLFTNSDQSSFERSPPRNRFCLISISFRRSRKECFEFGRRVCWLFGRILLKSQQTGSDVPANKIWI